MKSSKDYQKTKFTTEMTVEEASNTTGAIMGLEFLSLCRNSLMDVQAEYENYD